MATINNFEDLIIWQEARELCSLIEKTLTQSNYDNYQSLRNQMERSSGSVMDNIAEGFERGSNKEFIQYLYIAKGSCGELRSQIYRSYDKQLITESTKSTYIQICKKLGAQIFGFINYLKKSEYKGDKYNNVSEPEMNYGANSSNKLELIRETSNIKHQTSN